MKIGTFARSNEQIEFALQHDPDFIDLRMDLDHTIHFADAKKLLTDADVDITLHLPSDPNWKPIDLAKDIVPYIDLGLDIEAKLVTFHTQLSTLFYDDEDIDTFLQQVPLVCEALHECGVEMAIETLGLYYTELSLLFDAHPEISLALDIGHGQIMASRNRALGHIESFFERIKMVIVHDNNGQNMIDDILDLRKKQDVSTKETREIARKYDTHLPIGTGSIDFSPIFRELKEHKYDSKFLMMCNDHTRFPEEREKFEKLWLEA
ncbi:MAG: sugar phosphate isomerase/epimerase family protein [Candidatus Thorarchaeota archaeon]